MLYLNKKVLVSTMIATFVGFVYTNSFADKINTKQYSDVSWLVTPNQDQSIDKYFNISQTGEVSISSNFSPTKPGVGQYQMEVAAIANPDSSYPGQAVFGNVNINVIQDDPTDMDSLLDKHYKNARMLYYVDRPVNMEDSSIDENLVGSRMYLMIYDKSKHKFEPVLKSHDIQDKVAREDRVPFLLPVHGNFSYQYAAYFQPVHKYNVQHGSGAYDNISSLYIVRNNKDEGVYKKIIFNTEHVTLAQGSTTKRYNIYNLIGVYENELVAVINDERDVSVDDNHKWYIGIYNIDTDTWKKIFLPKTFNDGDKDDFISSWGIKRVLANALYNPKTGYLYFQDNYYGSQLGFSVKLDSLDNDYILQASDLNMISMKDQYSSNCNAHFLAYLPDAGFNGYFCTAGKDGSSDIYIDDTSYMYVSPEANKSNQYVIPKFNEDKSDKIHQTYNKFLDIKPVDSNTVSYIRQFGQFLDVFFIDRNTYTSSLDIYNYSIVKGVNKGHSSVENKQELIATGILGIGRTRAAYSKYPPHYIPDYADFGQGNTGNIYLERNNVIAMPMGALQRSVGLSDVFIDSLRYNPISYANSYMTTKEDEDFEYPFLPAGSTYRMDPFVQYKILGVKTLGFIQDPLDFAKDDDSVEIKIRSATADSGVIYSSDDLYANISGMNSDEYYSAKFQWYSCTDQYDTSSCTEISGATDRVYHVKFADIGKYIKLQAEYIETVKSGDNKKVKTTVSSNFLGPVEQLIGDYWAIGAEIIEGTAYTGSKPIYAIGENDVGLRPECYYNTDCWLANSGSDSNYRETLSLAYEPIANVENITVYYDAYSETGVIYKIDFIDNCGASCGFLSEHNVTDSDYKSKTFNIPNSCKNSIIKKINITTGGYNYGAVMIDAVSIKGTLS
ncbi:hypothetical protein [Cysteiniphilum sp. QT6929]|uniref:hypothetical protein n=1 Tax=Cysteiniphilum sp. QT6929 TaxID=2975055 RepID=UPI0024B36647|nr:hypothetical protein [Cysteiniphilum sp. QT6929]WHN66484.1 hypothetical protein NYP54_04455 [Cysteiniphilum sp. QT6929]